MFTPLQITTMFSRKRIAAPVVPPPDPDPEPEPELIPLELVSAQRESETLYVTFDGPVVAGTQELDQNLECESLQGSLHPSTSGWTELEPNRIQLGGWSNEQAFTETPEGFVFAIHAEPTLFRPAEGYTFVIPTNIQVYDL